MSDVPCQIPESNEPEMNHLPESHGEMSGQALSADICTFTRIIERHKASSGSEDNQTWLCVPEN